VQGVPGRPPLQLLPHVLRLLRGQAVRCPDPPVHPAAGSALRGPLRALAALAAVAAGVWVLAQMVSVFEAVALVILGSCVPASWVAWRMVRYGSLRKPRAAVNHTLIGAELVRAPYQIPAPPLAITASPADSVEHSRPRRYRAALREGGAVPVRESERLERWAGQ